MKGLKKIRQKAGYTQGKLAYEMPCSIQSIAAWEQGRRSPSKKSWKRLCEILHCTPNDIFEISR